MTNARWRLFLASFLMLYFELAMIRWVPGQVRVLAYFTNFVLIACFFGMGLGLITVKRFDAVRFMPAGVAMQVLLALAMRDLWIRTGGEIFLFLEYEGAGGHVVSVMPVLMIYFLAIAATFVPFGQAIGRGFGSENALADYAANLVGSLAGIAAFFVYSLFSFPAWAWFLLGLPLMLPFVPPAAAWRAAAVALFAVTVGSVAWMDRGVMWSPYHKLEITQMAVDEETGVLFPYAHQAGNVEPLPFETGFNLQVNDDFYQLPVDLSDASIAKYPSLTKWRDLSCLSCRVKENPERVLIVGGGTGNDAAAALRRGAKHVDVVDIDPRIVEIGRARHPERPYDDPRVSVHIDDARHFFHHAEPGYDAIIFALLDSHRLMGNLSSLRLDSYVFTVESFRQARGLLAPDGVQVTAFAVTRPWMQARFYEMLREAYGEEPIDVFENGVGTSGATYLSGPGAAAHSGLKVHPRAADTSVVKATDDWPFIYAKERTVPVDYLLPLGVVVLLAILALRAVGGQKALPEPHFFFLGAAFLLLETRGVTTLALVFGSTWYVNSVIFGSVLVMALFSTLLTSRFPNIPMAAAYAGLFIAVALNWIVPLQDFAGAPLLVRLPLVGGLTALPALFSGIVFARSFAQAADPARALGSNVLGGVIGGVVEYASLITGLKFLLLLVAAFYGLSWLALRGTRSPAIAIAP